MKSPDPEDAIDQGEVMRLLGGISDRTLDRMIEDGEFPDGFYGGRRDKKVWYRQDVQSYLWLRMRVGQRAPKRSPKKRAARPPEPPPGEKTE